MMAAVALSPTWDSKALLAKARRYASEMLAHSDRRDWHFAFWSSLTLELIARAALSHISPVLLADLDDRNNLYFALGYAPTAPKFSPKSIGTAQVLQRLRELVPAFEKELESFCVIHTGKRNAELHSGETPFDVGRSSEWLPTFYRASEVLLAVVGTGVSAFFGEDEAAAAVKIIAASADKTAQAVAKDVAAHKTVWERRSEAQRESMGTKAELWATRQEGHVVDCPACGSKALLNGEPIAAPRKTIDGDEITEASAMLPSQFECVACGLKLSKLSQLTLCGLGEPYTRTIRYDAATYYAPDDDGDGGYEDDNNEPF